MGHTHIKISQRSFSKRVIGILDSIRVPISMLARVETLAPLETNLVSYLADLLAQFGGHLDQI